MLILREFQDCQARIDCCALKGWSQHFALQYLHAVFKANEIDPHIDMHGVLQKSSPFRND